MDYDTLLNQKIHFSIILRTPLFLLIIFLVWFSNKSYYDTYKIMAISDTNYLYLNVPLDYSDTLNNGDYLKINDKKYLYEIIDISDIEVVENINYQVFTIKVEEEFKNNEVVNVVIYHNQEKIIKKIKKLL